MTSLEQLAAIQKMVALLPELLRRKECRIARHFENSWDETLIAGLSALQGVADGREVIVPIDKSGLGNQTGIEHDGHGIVYFKGQIFHRNNQGSK
jgi:hypothetical protein